MDPFSITAGVAGLLGTAATVIKFLDTVKSTIQDAPKTVAWALAEVSDVRSAIARLHGFFEHLDSVPGNVRALVTVQDAAVTVSELITSFDDLVDVLKPFGLSDPGLMKRWDKLKWARRQDDVAKAIMRIQVRKSSLALMLNIFQCESDIVAVESRLALENGINTIIESNVDIQKRLERMERIFEACIINAPPSSMLGYAGTHLDAVSVRSTGNMTLQARQALVAPRAQRFLSPAASSASVGAFGHTQDAGRMPVLKLEFEETLAKTGVYRRVQGPFDGFSICPSDNRSVTRTIMTTYTLADNASVLSRYPIIDRIDLRHPEFYMAVGYDQTRENSFLGSLVPHRRTSLSARGPPQTPVPRQKFRTPPNCGSDIMGAWSVSKRRVWRPTQFRFETLFEVPVIFVCHPSNKNGPVKNRPISFVSGTQQSLAATRVQLPESRVHTADDERASWVTLLSHLQSMEKESQEWQLKHYHTGPPVVGPPVEFYNHTLAVAIQAKTQSWDTMPANVKKPYATTAFSHLLEITAMMGIYWKGFDQSKKQYWAEGNGYTLTGNHIPQFGVLFTLQLYGRSAFQENRVIPVREVKELCCGFVPTVFQETNKNRHMIKSPIKDVSHLLLGSTDEIADTMVSLDCNADTVNCFRSKSTKYSHLFPVPFELIGMLGRTLHIRNSGFRMLPNPTPYHWNKAYFDLRQLVKEYRHIISDLRLDLPQGPQVQQLVEDTDILVQTLDQDTKSMTPGYSLPLLNTLHDILDRCDSFLKHSDRDLVLIVVREHFQAVLKLINEERQTTNGDDRSVARQRAKHFRELTAASPELREEVFMELYFYKVLGQVRDRAVTLYGQLQTAQHAQPAQPHEPSFASTRGIEITVSAPLIPSQSPLPRPSSPSSPRLETNEGSQSVPALYIQPPDDVPRPLVDDAATRFDAQASAIWCTLVLRMMCWLLLHDFDKRDVQIPKSELLGSRLPVYIA